jgi:RNA polymerase sigma factor (sigma-70 family)
MGDAEAGRQLVELFLPAIAGMARRFESGDGVQRRELIQEGVAGLLFATRRYDPATNTPFWAYASFWVRKAMQELVAEVTRPVALSDHAVRGLARVRNARRAFAAAHGTEPTWADIAAATGLKRAELDSLLAVERRPRAFDEPLGPDDAGGTTTLGETIADPDAEELYRQVLDQIEVRDLSAVLDDRERTVVWSHYGLGGATQTLTQIGAGLGVTAERVRQIEANALQKLRDAAAAPPEGGGNGGTA